LAYTWTLCRYYRASWCRTLGWFAVNSTWHVLSAHREVASCDVRLSAALELLRKGCGIRLENIVVIAGPMKELSETDCELVSGSRLGKVR
jgi:hypothetical protein